jgi:S-adenosylmethionine:tRNA ribosyltransferase-isomerase
MKLDDFDFPLPPELVAQEPAAVRDASRLLVIRGEETGHRHFRDLPDYLGPGDVLVLNDTRVFPARLEARKATGAAVEILLLREEGDGTEDIVWQALLKPARMLAVGEVLALPLGGTAVIKKRLSEKKWLLAFHSPGPFLQYLERVGETPLPPYIKRPQGEKPGDRERYQTVYARKAGSVAAPTAGLHFTPELLEKLKNKGVGLETITLHIGYGTFQPVQVENIAQHRVEEEYYEVTPETAAAINAARRVIAAGTTVMRTLESAADEEGIISTQAGWTDLYIRPGHHFRCVDALITNFHLPRSSLFLLVCAFGGREIMLAAYQEAIRQRYRFYSYGDCTLIFPQKPDPVRQE